MEDLRKARAKETVQSPAPSDASTSTVNQDTRYRDTRYKEPEPTGRPSEAPPARSRDDVPMPPTDEGRRGTQYPRYS